MDNPEKPEGAIKNGQSRETGNQEWTIQRNWQNRVQKTQDKDKKTQIQKAKEMSNTNPPYTGLNPSAREE
jgi:hypothetical protein